MVGLATSNIMAMPGMDLQFLMGLMLKYFLASLRIGSFLLSAPIFGARWMPLQVRIIMALALASAISADMPIPNADLLTSSAGFSIIFVEIAVGLAAGLTLSIWFAAVLLAGEKIASTSGLSYAAQIDPATGAQTPVVSQILYMFLLVIFLSIDGHLIAIATMLESYAILPVGAPVVAGTLIASGISAAGSMFLSATIIMLPISMALVLINLAIGIITRSAPQLNLFSFGFPITLLAVFFILYFSVGPLAESARSLIESALQSLQTMLGETNYG